jgi:hypothetical protein
MAIVSFLGGGGHRLVMAVVSFVSQSLPSNGSIPHSIINVHQPADSNLEDEKDALCGLRKL